MLEAWLLIVISVRRQKGENLIMRNKICHALIKEFKVLNLHRDLNVQCIFVNLRAYVASTINR